QRRGDKDRGQQLILLSGTPAAEENKPGGLRKHQVVAGGHNEDLQKELLKLQIWHLPAHTAGFQAACPMPAQRSCGAPKPNNKGQPQQVNITAAKEPTLLAPSHREAESRVLRSGRLFSRPR